MQTENLSSYGFVNVTDVVPDAILEIRYHSTFNFIGDRIDGYNVSNALITLQAASALKKAADELMDRGYRLKIFDAYRPQIAVDHFVRWAEDLSDTRMKKYFYPDVEKSRLFEEGFIAQKSGHSRGSTVDLTLFDMVTQREADMGGSFDFFGKISNRDCRDGLTDEQLCNRSLLRAAMTRCGFHTIQSEWWHFTLNDEPYPDTYFSSPIVFLTK